MSAAVVIAAVLGFALGSLAGAAPLSGLLRFYVLPVAGPSAITVILAFWRPDDGCTVDCLARGLWLALALIAALAWIVGVFVGALISTIWRT